MIRNKYGAKKMIVDGITFASKREAARYSELKLMERAGLISNLELQPKFKFEINGNPVLIKSEGYPNGRQATYIADFKYIYHITGGNKTVVEDAKGPKTSTYKLKKAIVEAMHPGLEIIEV